MPIYEYICKNCKIAEEKLLRIDSPPPDCPNCDRPMEKQITAANFAFKGKGFPTNDMKKNKR